jgi:hypothetical protein
MPLTPNATLEQIRDWSHGAVTDARLFDANGRTVFGGLECERTFGPVTDLTCHCGRYRGERFRAIVCPSCLVEVIPAASRSTRMGHLELPEPVQLEGYGPVQLVPVLPPALRPSTPDQTHPITALYQTLLTEPDTAASTLAQLRRALVEGGIEAYQQDLLTVMGPGATVNMQTDELPPVLGLEPWYRATLRVPPAPPSAP